MSERIENRILRALPAAELALVLEQARRFDAPAGRPLQRPLETIANIYFPERGVISVHNVLETGQNAAVSAIGREGMLGASTVLQIREAPPWALAIAQLDVSGLSLATESFLQLFDELHALRQLTLAHLGRYILEISRSGVCHRFHSHRQRLARWLVELARKSGQPSLALTHDAVAQLLGAPRHAVTTALNELRLTGAVEYARGDIRIVDEARLTTHACECCQRV